jgi:hypothetical protein
MDPLTETAVAIEPADVNIAARTDRRLSLAGIDGDG